MIPQASAAGASLIDMVPLKLVLWLASPYLAGQTADQAIAKAHQVYQENRFAATIDILGEDSESEEECVLAKEMYLDLIARIDDKRILPENRRREMTISIKPSMFCPKEPSSLSQAETDASYARIKEIVDLALKRSLNVTLEAEDHRFTDFQLETYKALINEGYSNCGTVLQSRLFRTASDIKSFDQRMRVRLVIGIYNEPASIALTDKLAMKERLIEQAEALMEKGTYVELATHDVHFVERFFRKVVLKLKAGPEQFETQFLLGVPRQKLEQSLADGSYFTFLAGNASGEERLFWENLAGLTSVVRLYLPFGKDRLAASYCKRRLKANPNMIAYGIKNLLHL